MIFNSSFGSIICYIGKFYFKDFVKFQVIWGELCENYHYRTDFFLSITNYQSFLNKEVNFYEFFFLST
jgi:hypothetical protein